MSAISPVCNIYRTVSFSTSSTPSKVAATYINSYLFNKATTEMMMKSYIWDRFVWQESSDRVLHSQNPADLLHKTSTSFWLWVESDAGHNSSPTDIWTSPFIGQTLFSAVHTNLLKVRPGHVSVRITNSSLTVNSRRFSHLWLSSPGCCPRRQSLLWSHMSRYHTDLGLGMMLNGGGSVPPSSK